MKKQNIPLLSLRVKRSNPEILIIDCRVANAPRNDDKSVLAPARMTANQKGNALFFILIAIALLGLLTVTMTRSGSSTNDTGGYEQNQITAGEILNYAKGIETGVQFLLSRGCSENEISFENSISALNYTSVNSPADKSCHIFDVAGAGLQYRNINDAALDKSYSADTSYLDIIFSGHVRITDVETTREELILYIPYIDMSVCEAINKIIGISNPPEVDDFNSTTPFTGSFGSPTSEIGESASVFAAEKSFCARKNTSSWYYLTHVLIAR